MSVDTRVAPTLADPTTRALWLGAILAFGIGDVVTTRAGFDRGLIEANPVARSILEEFGFSGLVAWKAVVILLFVWLFRAVPREFRAGVPIGLLVLGISITAFNLRLIRRADRMEAQQLTPRQTARQNPRRPPARRRAGP